MLGKCVRSAVSDCMTPWPVAHQAALPVELNRQEYWSISFSRESFRPRDWTCISCVWKPCIWFSHFYYITFWGLDCIDVLMQLSIEYNFYNNVIHIESLSVLFFLKSEKNLTCHLQSVFFALINVRGQSSPAWRVSGKIHIAAESQELFSTSLTPIGRYHRLKTFDFSLWYSLPL